MSALTSSLLSESLEWRRVARDIVGIKLEPIVALPSSRIVGMEVLSVLAIPDESERFFQQQSPEQSLALLKAQLASLKNHFPDENLFINLPITLLTETEFFRRVLPLLSPGINIEIVDPDNLFSLPAASYQRVVQRLDSLARRRCRIWLDDIDETQIQRFLRSRLTLSGIKIDKIAFWRLRATPALKELVSLCAHVAENVLIEGIESNWDRECALKAGAGFGQGYFWPSVGWPRE
ncbi:EAL domain-containing protein [Lelliottia sp. WAP21]|uniref:EAL domain-containing protein n=1 Tax=Lelliottia sp. WAP21 TaxID=2877426 RepID=UPI001E37DA2C